MTKDPILIVDDNPANLKVAKFALANEGYQVWTASDGEEALVVLREIRPKLILMDIQLPGMDGLELTRQLKADPATRDIVIVAVTAYAMKGDRERALLAGCDGYITKPIDPILLPTQVADHLGRSGQVPVAATIAEAPVAAQQPDGSNTSSAGELPPATKAPEVSEQTILLIEDNPATRRMYRLALETAGYDVIEARDGATALDALRRQRPTLIIQDLVLPDMDGLELARSIRQEIGDAPLPILCVSGFLSRLDEARAVKGGFAQVLVKPIDPFQLLDAVKTHLTSPTFLVATGGGRLLIVVDDDPLQRKLAQVWFSSAGFNVLVARDGDEGLELARRGHPAAIICDVLMPKMDGFALCLTVRRDPALVGIPVILISAAYTEKADHELAKRLGASALLPKAGGFEAVARALTAVLDVSPQVSPNEPIELLEREHDRRARSQLERQILENNSLIRNSTLQQAQLSVLAGIAAALTKNVLVDGVLNDVLASCLDTAGVSKGALFIMQDTGTLQLKHQIGFSEAENIRLRAKFGHEDLFVEIANRGRVVAVPSAALSADMAQRLIVDAGVTSLLLVPVTAGVRTYGTLLLGARNTDIEGEDALAFARVLGAQMGQAVGLAQTFEKLGASELRYRTLTDNANDAICILTPEGIVREVNRRLTELTGYPAEHFIGRDMREFATPSNETENVEECQAAIGKGGGLAKRYEIRKENGDVALLDFSTSRVEVGGETLVFSIGREVTEQVRAQERFRQAQKMEAIGQLAGGIAHDFNNLLTVIHGNTTLALEDLPAGHPVRAYLDEVTIASARAADLVRRILTFSHQETPERRFLSLPPVVHEAIQLLRAALPAMIEILTDLQGEKMIVLADPTQVHQVVMNLGTNAAHAMDNKGLLEFRLSLKEVDTDHARSSPDLRIGTYLLLSVCDSGAGMKKDVLDRMFDPFFTTKPQGQGTGLGLSVVHGIMKAHNGAIVVNSEPGKGTAFHVYFPVVPGVEAQGPIMLHEVRRGQGQHILYLDDEEPLVFLATRLLERQGYTVTGFTLPEEALEAFRTSPWTFDLIVTDHSMPKLSGPEFARGILRIRPDIPIVMATGYIRPEDLAIARTIGIREVMLKPNTVQEMGETLHKVLSKQATQTRIKQ